MSDPAFSDSIHLSFKISSRSSRKNSQDLGVGFGFRGRGDGLRVGGIAQIAVEFNEGGDGKFEELGEFRRVVRWQRWRGWSGRGQFFEQGNGQLAALGNIMLGQPDEIAAAADAASRLARSSICAKTAFGRETLMAA